MHGHQTFAFNGLVTMNA